MSEPMYDYGDMVPESKWVSKEEYDSLRRQLKEAQQERDDKTNLVLEYYNAVQFLTKQLATAQATEWIPLPDGLYLDGALAVSYKGTDIGLKIDDEPYKVDDWINNYQWLSDCEIRDYRTKDELDNYRLCRRTTRQPVPVVPDDIARELYGILEKRQYCKDCHGSGVVPWIDYANDDVSLEPCLCWSDAEAIIEKYKDAVWLEAQGGEQ